jgi:hypothetical protein
MSLNWKTFAFVTVVGIGGWNYWQERPLPSKPGTTQLASHDPQQTQIKGDAPQFAKDGYRLTALAGYDVTARVLSKESYYFGREADLAPLDFALGWGAMSDDKVLAAISISQSKRFYYWHVNEYPIPREEIESNSANTHLIPSNSTIEKRLKAVRPGAVVHLRGYLVKAEANDGWRWTSSLSRNDTGSGACELLWVQTVETL